MIRIFLIVILLVITSVNASNIDNKINKNKKSLTSQGKQKLKAKVKVKLLAKQINTTTKKFKNIESDINIVNEKIKKNNKTLISTKDQLKLLELKSDQIIEEKEKVQIGIVDSLIENYSSSIAIGLASKHTLDEIIDSHIYKILSNESKVQINNLDNQYKLLIKNQISNKKQIKKLKTFISKDLEDKKKLSKLEEKYTKTLSKLEKKHTTYQKELKKIINKQHKLSSLLGKLNILKKQELKEADKKREAKKKKWLKKQKKLALDKKIVKTKIQTSKISAKTKKFNDDIKMDVRSIGSSASGIKTTKYRGKKTIAPIKNYAITKKFGKSYDKVYKIQLFNDSITLKTKSINAKVYSVLSGKVVYSKKNSGLLENVVIVKHKNNLHTIYSHLDQIAPTIKKGKWVKKGSVLGRIDDTLIFQATKSNKYINPKDLF
ncbi:MAG: M23 family metallopeptidase [Campylobacteraceae bacterium]|nr:M23 family metallopeptidase [Campylobacteraceae bacterium]